MQERAVRFSHKLVESTAHSYGTTRSKDRDTQMFPLSYNTAEGSDVGATSGKESETWREKKERIRDVIASPPSFSSSTQTRKTSYSLLPSLSNADFVSPIARARFV